jgi:hypothetical protein
MRDAKAEFLATRENRADSCKDPRVRSECSAFPVSSRVIGYFTARAISGFEARYFDTRHWNARPIAQNRRRVRTRCLRREKSHNGLDRERSKRSGVRMIATRAGSKAKALLPSGWFRRGGRRSVGAYTCIASLFSRWRCSQRRAVLQHDSNFRAGSLDHKGTRPMPRAPYSSARIQTR